MQIQTERRIIRNYQQTDLEDIHEYGSDPEVVKYVPFGPNTLEDSQNFLNRAIDKQLEKPRVDYGGAVVLKSEDKLRARKDGTIPILAERLIKRQW